MTYMKLKPALFLSFSAFALLQGCATSLANRTPVDIASNSVRHLDPISGISEILGPRVGVFTSNDTGISGSAQLRTAGAFTDNKGQVFKDGTYLDILINYTTPTPAPQESRGFDTANWAGGQEALLAEYGAAVLDCRQDIRENYTPAYNSYGYGYGNSGRRYNGGRRHDHDNGRDRDRDRNHDNGRDRDRDHDRDRDTDNDDTKQGQNAPTRTPTRTPGLPDRYTPTPGDRDLSLEPYLSNGPRRGGIKPSTRQSSPRRGGIKPSTVRPQPMPEPRVVSPAPRPVPTVTPTPKPVVKPNTRRKDFEPVKGKELNYYPGDPYYGGGYTDVTVRTRCAREESLRVFVPKERLDDAEYRGLVLYLRPRAGREEALFLPPNYVTGFKLAAYSPQGPEFTMQGEPITIENNNKPKDKPIIYGQP